MDTYVQKIFLYLVIVLSATFHEYAHGFMAYALGDSTAKDEGRLTLNPLAHLDLFGTVLLPLFLLFYGGIFIGWAKPVPYNPDNLRDKKFGSLKVGVAGPAANFIIALILGIFFRIVNSSHTMVVSPLFLSLIGLIVYVNVILALFNLMPIPPLDGSKVIMDLFPQTRDVIARAGFLGIIVAMFVAFLILSPAAGFIFRAITGTAPF